MNTKTLNAKFELKQIAEDGIFEGYASVFGVKDYDGDVIVKGAFKSSVEKMDGGKRPKMLWQHNPSIIIGKWLNMYEDERGLYVKGQLFLDTQKGLESYTLMKHGELDGMSVGFNIANAYMNEQKNRVIDDLELWEISVVTWGANPEALVTSVKSIRDFEKFLRDSGFSRKDATRIASHGFKSSETLEQEQRDADEQKAITLELSKLLESLK
jgi:HK97 family phage prohead protease